MMGGAGEHTVIRGRARPGPPEARANDRRYVKWECMHHSITDCKCSHRSRCMVGNYNSYVTIFFVARSSESVLWPDSTRIVIIPNFCMNASIDIFDHWFARAAAAYHKFCIH
jgi:hypothetical protein